jgi:hypothetical protein
MDNNLILQLVYVSSATRLMDTAELHDLLEKARAKNKASGITGMLLYQDGNFIQAIERPQTSIKQLLAALLRDPRHHHVTVVWERPASKRDFADWSMGFRRIDSSEAIPDGMIDVRTVGHTLRQSEAMTGGHILRFLRTFADTNLE